MLNPRHGTLVGHDGALRNSDVRLFVCLSVRSFVCSSVAFAVAAATKDIAYVSSLPPPVKFMVAVIRGVPTATLVLYTPCLRK